jgi:hypothetical protein
MIVAVYEVGWGKKLSYVIAVSKDEVQDVSWRYSVDHAGLKSRRTLVREQWLTATLLALTTARQEKYDEEKKKKMVERRCVIILKCNLVFSFRVCVCKRIFFGEDVQRYRNVILVDYRFVSDPV